MRWLDPQFVAEKIAKGSTFYCSNRFKSSKRERMAQRTVCLYELRLGEDGLLRCPVHGKEICE